MTEHSYDYDAIIIGAGVIGAAIGHELAGRGWRTLNVDKTAAAGAGSTINSCAIVRFSYSTTDGVMLAWEGLHYWTDWANYIGTDDESGLIEYYPVGQMLVCSEDNHSHSEKVKRIWDEVGIPHEVWSVDEIKQRLPIFDLGLYGPPKRPDDDRFWDDANGEITGAYFSPEAGYVSDPQLSCHNLQRGAEANGGEFWFNAEIVAVDRSDERVTGVTLADGRTPTAAVVVNAAGPHSMKINQMAGVYEAMNIKTRALRHEVHHVPSPAGFDFMSKGLVAADDDLGIYFRPETGNNILVGSGDPLCDPREFVDPDHYDRTLTESQWEAQVLRANRRMPDLGMPHDKKGIVDLYDVSDDWIPIYDRTDLNGFYAAIGTSGNQYKNAGVAGQMMAELITACEDGHDHDNDPLVVSGRYTGTPISVGFFSRNREINPDSSMSVHG